MVLHMRQNICKEIFVNEVAESAMKEYQESTDNKNALAVICIFAKLCCEKSYYLTLIPEKDREDICQDVVVRVLEQIDNYDAKRNKEGRGTSVKAWINQMIYSICNDELRRKTSKTGGNRIKREFSSLDGEGYKECMSKEAWNIIGENGCHKIISVHLISGGRIEDPEQAFDEKYVNEALWNAIDQLPERYAEVIKLYYYADWSIRKITKKQGCSETAAKKVLVRARNKMRDYLEKYELKVA